MKKPGTSALTAADVLQPCSWFLYSSEKFEIVTWDSQKPLDVDARSATTGTIRHFTVLELFGAQTITRFAATPKELESEEEKSKAWVADVATLPEQLLKQADHIIETVETVQSQINEIKRQYQVSARSYSLADITEQACQSIAAPVGRSSYYAYRRLWQSGSGDRALIASALRRKTFGKTRIDPNPRRQLEMDMATIRNAHWE